VPEGDAAVAARCAAAENVELAIVDDVDRALAFATESGEELQRATTHRTQVCLCAGARVRVSEYVCDFSTDLLRRVVLGRGRAGRLEVSWFYAWHSEGGGAGKVTDLRRTSFEDDEAAAAARIGSGLAFALVAALPGRDVAAEDERALEST
jgi:hypothetical protein